MMRTPRLLLLLVLSPIALLAQASGATKDSVPAAPPQPAPRAGWLSDRRDLRVGDLLTIVVDEHVQSTERTTNTAHNTRSQAGTLDIAQVPADLKSIGIGYKAQSDRGGQADHSGGLDAVLTVRVASIEANGVVKIQGQKFVAMDGRKQEVTVTGLVRTEDVGASNTIASSRIANATISYKGKSISPSTGIFGKILAILWP